MFDRVKESLKLLKGILFLLNILLFIFTSIFTFITIKNNWGNNALSYALLGCFIINVTLYLIIMSLKKQDNKNLKEKNLVNILNVVRKISGIGNVILSLIITFSSYSNSAISLFSKIVMTYMSLSMAIIYILSQVFILFVRNQVDKVSKKWKEGYRETLAKIKNKRVN